MIDKHVIHCNEQLKKVLLGSNHLNDIFKLAFSFFLQYHWVVHQNTGQGYLPRHESFQCGVFDRISWILRRLVHGFESFGQTRHVSVRLLFLSDYFVGFDLYCFIAAAKRLASS